MQAVRLLWLQPGWAAAHSCSLSTWTGSPGRWVPQALMGRLEWDASASLVAPGFDAAPVCSPAIRLSEGRPSPSWCTRWMRLVARWARWPTAPTYRSACSTCPRCAAHFGSLRACILLIEKWRMTCCPTQGPAVWALRAQTDKVEYARLMRGVLEATPNLALREGMAVDVELGPNDEVLSLSAFVPMAAVHVTCRGLHTFSPQAGQASQLRRAGDRCEDTVWADLQVPCNCADHWHIHERQDLGGTHVHASWQVCPCSRVPRQGHVSGSRPSASSPVHLAGHPVPLHCLDCGARHS